MEIWILYVFLLLNNKNKLNALNIASLAVNIYSITKRAQIEASYYPIQLLNENTLIKVNGL